MELRVAFATDRGRLREQNEDALLADPPLVAVADGMGGHVYGEVASKLALEVLASWKGRLAENNNVSETLKEAFGDANRAVFEKAQEDQKLRGMGTTLTAAWVGDASATVAHVGDSRAYLLRATDLKQLTEDQTVAQEWVRRGRISKDEAETSPHRHVLLQAIGNESNDLDVDVLTVELRGGDRLIVASDGLYGMLRDNEIRDILISHPDANDACQALVDAANAAGGEDNISLVIVEASGETAAGTPVVVEKPAADKRGGLSRRTALMGAGTLLLAILAFVFFVFVRPATSALVLASRSSRAVVLRGQPGSDDKPAKGKVVHVFRDQPVKRFALPVQRQLRTGIVVASIDDARNRLENFPRKLGDKETPPPTPKPTPTTSPGAKTPLPTTVSP